MVVVSFTECYIFVGLTGMVELRLRLKISILANVEEWVTDWHIGVAIVSSQRVSNNLRPVHSAIVMHVVVMVDVVDVITIGIVVVSVSSTQRIERVVLGHREVVSVQGIPVAIDVVVSLGFYPP